MILILPRLLSRLEGKEKGDLELHLGFRFLNLHKILYLIWSLKFCLKEMNVCKNLTKTKSFLGKSSILHES